MINDKSFKSIWPAKQNKIMHYPFSKLMHTYKEGFGQEVKLHFDLTNENITFKFNNVYAEVREYL